MTGSRRCALKTAVDAAVRAQVVFPPEFVDLPGNISHGTENGYKYLCRCERCSDAANRARARRYGRVRTHSASGYRNGCRCDVCTVDERRRSRERYWASVARAEAARKAAA